MHMNEPEIKELIRTLFTELCERASGKCPFKGANNTKQVDLYINAVLEDYLKQREWSMSDIVILAKHLSTALNPFIVAEVKPIEASVAALELRVATLEKETIKLTLKTKIIWAIIGVTGTAIAMLIKDLVVIFFK